MSLRVPRGEQVVSHQLVVLPERTDGPRDLSGLYLLPEVATGQLPVETRPPVTIRSLEAAPGRGPFPVRTRAVKTLAQPGRLTASAPALARVHPELGLDAFNGIIGDQKDVDGGRLPLAALPKKPGLLYSGIKSQERSARRGGVRKTRVTNASRIASLSVNSRTGRKALSANACDESLDAGDRRTSGAPDRRLVNALRRYAVSLSLSRGWSSAPAAAAGDSHSSAKG
jgi:hypothetical protein